MAHEESGITIYTSGTDQLTPLGKRQRIPACDGADRTLFYVDSGYAIKGGPAYQNRAAATDIAIKHYANTGDALWVYVKAGAAITAGQAVMADMSAGDGVVIVGTGASPTVGFAQYDIDSGSYGWVLAKGRGLVLADGLGITVELGLVVAAGGVVSDRNAITDGDIVAQAPAAIGAGAIGEAQIFCPGVY